MIRVSEMVLAGHPDKFSDQVADAIVAAVQQFEPDSYAQVEVAAWCDDIWINGGIATTCPMPFTLEEIVQNVVNRVGYITRDGAPRKFHVHSETVCLDVIDPTQWTHKVNDQAIVIGYAGYDEKTAYLPPEHYAAHHFREALEAEVRGRHAPVPVECRDEAEVRGRPAPAPVECRDEAEVRGRPAPVPVECRDAAEVRGRHAPAPVNSRGTAEEETQGSDRSTGTGARRPRTILGPDGKLLLRMREERDEWRIEHILVTIQQSEDIAFLDVVGIVEQTLREAYHALQRRDPRWCADWDDIQLLVNPNGPLVHGGSDGDNGQTGRKLVMDYYGPRVAIGGGALSGKHLTHIDRLAAYAAREAAVRAVTSMKGESSECRVVLSYAPNDPVPLDMIYEMTGPGERMPPAFFEHNAMRDRYARVAITSSMPQGDHFLNANYPWN